MRRSLEQAGANRVGGRGRPRGELELAQDVGDVAVNGVLAHHQPLGDLPVREALGEQAQHLPLPRRELGEGSRPPPVDAASSRRARAASALPRARAEVQRRGRLAARPRRRVPARRRLVASSILAWAASNGAPLRSKRSTASSSSVRARSWSPPAAAEHALGQVDARPQRRGADHPLDLAELLEGRARLVELAARDPGADEQLERRARSSFGAPGSAQQPLEKLDSPARLAAVEREAGAAELGRRRRPPGRAAARPRPACPGAVAARPAPTQRSPAHAGREREKSSTAASEQLPPPPPSGRARGAPRRTRPGRRRACSGSRSARRTRRSGRTTRTRARSRAPPCTR